MQWKHDFWESKARNWQSRWCHLQLYRRIHIVRRMHRKLPFHLSDWCSSVSIPHMSQLQHGPAKQSWESCLIDFVKKLESKVANHNQLSAITYLQLWTSFSNLYGFTFFNFCNTYFISNLKNRPNFLQADVKIIANNSNPKGYRMKVGYHTM